MAMAPGERDAVRAQRQAEFEPATRCGCTRPLEREERPIHRLAGRDRAHRGTLRRAGSMMVAWLPQTTLTAYARHQRLTCQLS
jgi:hypothetical protein